MLRADMDRYGHDTMPPVDRSRISMSSPTNLLDCISLSRSGDPSDSAIERCRWRNSRCDRQEGG